MLISIGVMTTAGRACFGRYAEKTLPDLDLRTRDIDDAIDELLALSTDGHRPNRRPPAPRAPPA